MNSNRVETTERDAGTQPSALSAYKAAEGEENEDIYLDEFSDEIDQWVIDAIKSIGLDTAKAVLNAPREMLVEKADLEEETVDQVLEVLRKEFE